MSALATLEDRLADLTLEYNKAVNRAADGDGKAHPQIAKLRAEIDSTKALIRDAAAIDEATQRRAQQARLREESAARARSLAEAEREIAKLPQLGRRIDNTLALLQQLWGDYERTFNAAEDHLSKAGAWLLTNGLDRPSPFHVRNQIARVFDAAGFAPRRYGFGGQGPVADVAQTQSRVLMRMANRKASQ